MIFASRLSLWRTLTEPISTYDVEMFATFEQQINMIYKESNQFVKGLFNILLSCKTIDNPEKRVMLPHTFTLPG